MNTATFSLLTKQRLLLLCCAAAFFLSSCADPAGPNENQDLISSFPAAEGMDGTTLHQLSDAIKSGTYGTMHSLVILRHDRIVFEEYYNGSSRSALHPAYSVTKSVLSLMTGVAATEGTIASLQAPLLSFIANSPVDSARRAITLEHALTMTAGLAWDELSMPYSDPSNDVYRMTRSADWLQYAASCSVVVPTGTQFRYNSGLTLMLGEAIRVATGRDVEAMTRDRLFTPLGIVEWKWTRGPGDVVNTFGGLQICTRDLAKIGIVVLRGGVWKGTRIVSASWIDASTRRHSGATGEFGYGYQWWIHALQNTAIVSPEPDDVKIAWGWGGQHMIVIPKLDLVVAVTAGNYDANDDQAIRFLFDFIVPSVRTR